MHNHMSLNDARMKKNACLELWNHGHIFWDWVLAPRVGGTPMLGSLEEYLLVVGVLSGDHCVLKCLILKCKSWLFFQENGHHKTLDVLMKMKYQGIFKCKCVIPWTQSYLEFVASHQMIYSFDGQFKLGVPLLLTVSRQGMDGMAGH